MRDQVYIILIVFNWLYWIYLGTATDDPRYPSSMTGTILLLHGSMKVTYVLSYHGSVVSVCCTLILNVID